MGPMTTESTAPIASIPAIRSRTILVINDDVNLTEIVAEGLEANGVARLVRGQRHRRMENRPGEPA